MATVVGLRHRRALVPLLAILLMAGNQAMARTPTPGGNPRNRQAPPAAVLDQSAAAHARQAYGELGLRFEANQGQNRPEVKFSTRGPGYDLYLTPNEAVLALPPPPQGGEERGDGDIVRMRLVGANPDPKVEGARRLPGVSNYLRGNEAEKWITGVPSYAAVRYRSVYPGVDMVYYGDEEGRLEYDFLVAPGADPRPITLAFEGHTALALDVAGNLVIAVGGEEVRQHPPVVYQEVEGRRRPVEGRYVADGDRRVRFEVGDYDETLALVIDPVLTYSSYLGEDANLGIAVYTDTSSGRTYGYVGGTTCGGASRSAASFQSTSAGGCDLFITKLDPTAGGEQSLVWTTYLGGSSHDFGSGLAADQAGNVYVTGQTVSVDFPVTPTAFDSGCGIGGDCDAAALEDLTFHQGPGTLSAPSRNPPDVYPDAFVAKLSADGSVLSYSSFLGGQRVEEQTKLAVNRGGVAYVTGLTTSIDFPATPDAYDPTCGADASCDGAAPSEAAHCMEGPGMPADRWDKEHYSQSVQLSSAGITLFLPHFHECNLGGREAYRQDAFLTAIDTSKAGNDSLVYSTYVGGDGADTAPIVALDGSGSAVYVGWNHPPSGVLASEDAFQNVRGDGSSFLMRFDTHFDAGHKARVRATYFPAGLAAIAADSSDVYVAGGDRRGEVPITDGAYQKEIAASDGNKSDAYVAKLKGDLTGPALHATYLGGGGGAFHDDFATGIAVDGRGTVYLTGQAGGGPESWGDFPTTSDAFQRAPECENQSYCVEAFFATVDTTAGSADEAEASLTYSTYIGGSPGARYGVGQQIDATKPDPLNVDFGRSIAVDEAGDAYVVGTAQSPSFPWVNPLSRTQRAGTESFVAKFAARPPVGPYVSSLSRTRGPASGGNRVVLSGSGLAEAAGVRFGANIVRCPSVGCTVHPSGGSIEVMTPLEVDDTTVDVTATSQRGTSPVASFARFSYEQGAWNSAACSQVGACPAPRHGHTTTLLHDGRVLIVGGAAVEGGIARPQLFDPRTSAWSDTELPTSAAEGIGPAGHSATLLRDGRVLVVGGSLSLAGCPHKTRKDQNRQNGQAAEPEDTCDPRSPTRASWVFDPDPPPGGAYWSGAASLDTARFRHSATLLPDGKVLVAFGLFGVHPPYESDSLEARAEVYDPVADQWTVVDFPAPVGKAEQPESRTDCVDRLDTWCADAEDRFDHTATALGGPACEEPATAPSYCGKVLVVGGRSFASSVSREPNLKSAAELSHQGSVLLYDPSLASWSRGPEINLPRSAHTATLRSDGKVLVAGGDFEGSHSTDTVEIYDPASNTWGFGAALGTERQFHDTVSLPSGQLLAVGGASPWRSRNPVLTTAELHDSPFRTSAARWVPAGRGANRSIPPAGPSTVIHPDTYVNGVTSRATVLSSDSQSFEADPAVCGGNCGKVLVIGGSGLGGEAFTTELYTPAPAVRAVRASAGSASGGDTVTIDGAGFTNEVRVMFGGVAAESFEAVSDRRIVAVLPKAAKAATVDVMVVHDGVGVGVAPEPFTYQGGPARVEDLKATAMSGREVKLSFSAPGTVGDAEPVARTFVVKQSRVPIDEATFDAAQSLCGGLCRYEPDSVGDDITLSTADLTPDTDYYYALRAEGREGALGPISNVAKTTTGSVGPGRVAELVATALSPTEVQLTYSAPGANEAGPPAAEAFIVKQSRQPFDHTGFDSVRSLCGGLCRLTPAPGRVGDEVTLSVGGLRPDTTYHYMTRAQDGTGSVGSVSNLASVTTPLRCPDLSEPGSAQVAYPAGYSLVSLPERSVVASQSPLYGWFDLGARGAYSVKDAGEPVESGRAYWAWFSCPRLVDMADGGSTGASFGLGAYHASMVGNPSGKHPASVSGHDFAARWDPGLNDGSGGYHISSYRAPQGLSVGEGMWVFSYVDTTISIVADEASLRTLPPREMYQATGSYHVTPRTASDQSLSSPQANEGARGFSVSNLGNEAVRVALFPCGAASTDHTGATTFADAEGRGVGDATADGLGTTSSNSAAIETMEDRVLVPTRVSGPLVASDVTIAFSVDAVAPDCALPVVFADANGNVQLDLDDHDRPTEAFAVGGRTNFVPLEGGSIPNVDVASTDKAAKSFAACAITAPGPAGAHDPAEVVGPCRTFSYDANDTFTFHGVPQPAGEAGVAAFEAAISSRDDIIGTYYSDAAASSTFDLSHEAPSPPLTATALRSPASPTTEVMVSFADSPTTTVDAYNVHRAKAVGLSCPDSIDNAPGVARLPNAAYTKVATVDDVPGASGADAYRFTDSELTPGKAYCYAVAAVDDTDESDTARQSDGGGGPNTAVLTARVTVQGAPTILDARSEDRGAVRTADVGDVHEFSFSEPLHSDADRDGARYTVSDAAGTTGDFVCGTSALCFLQPASGGGPRPVAMSPSVEARGENTVLRVYLVSPPAALDYPLTVTGVSADFRDADEGIVVDLSAGDRKIESLDGVPPVMRAAEVAADDTITVEYTDEICAAVNSRGDCGGTVVPSRFRLYAPTVNTVGCEATSATLHGTDKTTLVLRFPGAPVGADVTTATASPGLVKAVNKEVDPPAGQCRGVTTGRITYTDDNTTTLSGDIVDRDGEDAPTQRQPVTSAELKLEGSPVIIDVGVSGHNQITVKYSEAVCAAASLGGDCGGDLDLTRFTFTSAEPRNTFCRPSATTDTDDNPDEIILRFSVNTMAGCAGLKDGTTRGSLSYSGGESISNQSRSPGAPSPEAGKVVDLRGNPARSQVVAVPEPDNRPSPNEDHGPLMLTAKAAPSNSVVVTYSEGVCAAGSAPTCPSGGSILLSRFSLARGANSACSPSSATGVDDGDPEIVLTFASSGDGSCQVGIGTLTYVDEDTSTMSGDVMDAQGNDAVTQTEIVTSDITPPGSGDVIEAVSEPGPAMSTVHVAAPSVVMVTYSEEVCAAKGVSGAFGCGGTIDLDKFFFAEDPPPATRDAVPRAVLKAKEESRDCRPSAAEVKGRTIALTFERPFPSLAGCRITAASRGTISYIDPNLFTAAGDVMDGGGHDAPTQTIALLP